MKRLHLIATLSALTCASAANANSAGEGDGEEKDPYEWVIETYPFPSDELSLGFTSRDRGALRAPALPAAGSDVEQIRDFLRTSNSITSHYLETAGLALPKGGMVIFDPGSLTLTARLPRIAHSSIHFTAKALQDRAPQFVAIDQTIFEAPSASVRSIIERAGGQADHRPLLEELEALVADGRGRVVSSGRMETKSGQRTSLRRAEELAFAVDLAVDADGRVEFTSDSQSAGTSWEIDPVIGVDAATVDLNVALDHHYAAPRKRQEPLTAMGAASISAAVTDTFNATVTTAITTMSGDAKLVGVWKPEGLAGAAPDVLHAAFLATDVVAVLPLPNERLEALLREHGEAVSPTPEGAPEFEQVADEIPEGMIVRRFRIPPSFLAGGAASGGSSVDDPFASVAPSEPRFTIQATAQDILRSMGIPFPEGSSANYLAASSDLIVRNTPENIALVEAYVLSLMDSSPVLVAISVHLVQAPGGVLRRSAQESRALADHQRIWEALSGEEGVRILGSYWLESRSGQRAKIVAGRNHAYHTEATLTGGASAASAPKGDGAKPEATASASARIDGGGSSMIAVQDVGHVGTELEVDAVVGPDGVTIDLNVGLLHDYAEPRVGGLAEVDGDGNLKLDGPTTSFREAKVATAMTLRSGMIRMLGMWQPSGTPEFDDADILQAAFIRAEVVRVDGDLAGRGPVRPIRSIDPF